VGYKPINKPTLDLRFQELLMENLSREAKLPTVFFGNNEIKTINQHIGNKGDVMTPRTFLPTVELMILFIL
jgi:hypothetical protein